LKVFWVSDSVVAMRFATGADHDGAAQSRPGQLFYSFSLDDAVPDDHPVREIAAVLDLSWVHAELAPYYPQFGRPSIDPVLMIRMLIIGYLFAIRSERALCRDVRGFAGCRLRTKYRIIRQIRTLLGVPLMRESEDSAFPQHTFDLRGVSIGGADLATVLNRKCGGMPPVR
jgi:hypothetical protein